MYLRITRKRVLILVALASLVVAGSVAYAAIPSDGGVFKGCMLKGVGTVRLIDPTLPSTSLLSHCTTLEQAISWNEKGQPGADGATGAAGKPGADGSPGTNGTDGTNGTNGVSPTVAPLAVGDSHCATGGAALTDAAGTTAYVCNGETGATGQNGAPFSGTFTSPNGQFSIGVTDTGVTLHGPGVTKLDLTASGVTLESPGSLLVRIGTLATIESGDSLTVKGGSDLVLHGAANATIDAGNKTTVHGSTVSVQSAGLLALLGPVVTLNGGGTCAPAARVGDSTLGVAPPGGGNILSVIQSGSASVCIG